MRGISPAHIMVKVLKMIRVLVVDDHPVVRHGLIAILRYEPGIEVVGDAADGLERCG